MAWPRGDFGLAGVSLDDCPFREDVSSDKVSVGGVIGGIDDFRLLVFLGLWVEEVCDIDFHEAKLPIATDGAHGFELDFTYLSMGWVGSKLVLPFLSKILQECP